MIHRAKKRTINRAPIILLPLLALGALAQDPEPEEEPVEVRRYTVELMIFAYGQSISVGSEVFVPDEPPPFEFGVDEVLIDFIFGDETMPAEFAKPDEPALTEVELISKTSAVSVPMTTKLSVPPQIGRASCRERV